MKYYKAFFYKSFLSLIIGIALAVSGMSQLLDKSQINELAANQVSNLFPSLLNF